VIDWRIFATVFGVIFVAELPDKTALAALVLATRYRPWPVYLGTALALTVQSLIAIVAGKLLSLLPTRPVHIGAGVLFVVSAVFMWRRNDEDEDDAGSATPSEPTFGRALASTFGVVFIAEWGDLTQLGTAALAARYGRPMTVFLGATLALWAVAGIAVFVGNRAGKLMDPTLTKKIAAIVFVLLGLALITGLL
jgi:putative Ca2+/H+ antiporter (TMEM165/GDT1 family)